ncbi:MAG: glycosyltransferase [Lachnospiraceae bacterium]|nr:glycosyltransferase [Lachnospiraceae bacterium]
MGNKQKNFISVVVYVHNAESRIDKFLSIITSILENNFEHSEIICVNDDSTDNSVEIIKEFSRNVAVSSITVLNMSYFHGLETAMNAGIDLTIGDFVFEFDSTVLDFEKEEIMNVYYRSLQGYDIVSASPNKKEKISSQLFYRVFDHFANLPYKMSTERFRILSRRVINRIGSMNKTIPYRKVVYANSGLKTDNMKYSVIGTADQKADKREKSYRFGLAVDSLILFTEIGYRMSMLMAVLMMAVSVLMVAYSVIIYLAANPVTGWTTTILFLSVAFAGLFGILTVVIKYLQLLVDLVFKRKHYSFESIEKLTR